MFTYNSGLFNLQIWDTTFKRQVLSVDEKRTA